MSVVNKAVVRRLYEEAFGQGKPEVLDEVLNPDFVCYYPNAEGGEDYWLQRTFSLPGQGGRKMPMRERLRKGKAEQERRALQAARRADEIWSASSLKMRTAEREPREAVYRAEMLKWRIEGRALRPRQPRSLEAGRH